MKQHRIKDLSPKPTTTEDYRRDQLEYHRTLRQKTEKIERIKRLQPSKRINKPKLVKQVKQPTPPKIPTNLTSIAKAVNEIIDLCMKCTFEIIRDSHSLYKNPYDREKFNKMCRTVLREMISTWDDQTWFYYEVKVTNIHALQEFYRKYFL